MLLFLNSFTMVNAEIDMISNCSEITSQPTKGNSLYSHSEIFGSAATLKDAEAFKFYCTYCLIRSTIKEKMVSIIIAIMIRTYTHI